MAGPWPVEEASAADPIKVTITGGGPDRPYPLGQDFRVEGKPAKVPEQVDLVFIRAAQNILGIGDPSGKTCQEVKRRILDERENVRAFKEGAPVGRTTVDALWDGPGGDISELSAYRASSWKRESEKDTTYSLFVPSDSMFMPGASYCAFLLQTDKAPLVTKGMLEAVTTFVEGWSVCEGRKAPNDCTTVGSTYTNAFTTALDASNLDEKGKADVQKQLDGLLNALREVNENYKHWGVAVASWDREVFKMPPDESKDAEAPNLIPIADGPKSPLARMIADMLVAQGELVAIPTEITIPATKDTPARDEWHMRYIVPQGMLPVTHVTIQGDTEEIQVRTQDRSRAPIPLKTKTSGLFLPGSKITLRDVLELRAGKLRFGSKPPTYLTLAEGNKKILGTVLDWNGLDISSQKLESSVDPFLAWLDELDLALTRAWQAGPPAAPTSQPVPYVLTWTPLYASLGAWLKSSALNTCDKMPMLNQSLNVGHQPAPLPPPAPPPPPATPAWPGCPDNDFNPVRVLKQTLGKIRTGAVQAQAYKTALQGRTQLSSTTIASTINVAGKVDRNAWFGQHVVTTVGIANVVNSAEPLWVNYYGFKLYPWANPVDEPRWVGSPGPYRNLSLELALVPNVNAFGSSGRYQGVSKGDIPPLMAGLALQPVPYVTISGGLIFMEIRRTVIPQETASTFVSPYLAFAADINLLDLAATALSQGRTTTISALAKP
ncbi:hypothetical protein WME97_45850 [Sorangium sp. So ce367]|uniref:hypothetical protein n=1 Tax=Sorangium sp. So ce367 TaxID=3133305 RepID=UPI003F632D01